MRFVCAAAFLAGCTFTAVAFVADINSSGQARRWKLNPPDTRVHTNVVNRSAGAK